MADAALLQGHWLQLEVTDRNPQRCAGELLPGVPLVGIEALTSAQAVHIAIGGPTARQSETRALPGNCVVATVIHPAATVSSSSVIGAGSFIAAGAVVSALARLGEAAIVNHLAVIDHDCDVGDFCHVAPGAMLGGGVRLGRGVLIGAGARVLPGLSIADGVQIGAGAVVIRDIDVAGTYVGMPARRVK